MDLWNLAVVRLLSIFNPLEKDCCNDDSSLTRMQRMRMASTVTSCLSHGALQVPVGHRQLWRTHKIDTHTHTQSHTDMTNEKNTLSFTHTQTHTQMASIASHDAKMMSLKPGVSGKDFFCSRERERKLKITFPFYGKGTGIRICHGKGREI